jgi:anti-sigma regulatory factor (Ser/Thr protein kinase)
VAGRGGGAGDAAAGASRGVAGAVEPRISQSRPEPDTRLKPSATHPSDSHGSISIRIHGGVDAPGHARKSVLSQLDGQVAGTTASDAALIVSELVTNSVVHAHVDASRALTVELMTLDDRLRIIVIDPGSRLEPRILPCDPETAGGFGLFVVSELSVAWGVSRDGIGPTCVWCDLLLDRSPRRTPGP